MEQHVLPLISDYVLGLAPEADRRTLETHILRCASCRHALERERTVEALVHQTVQAATQPSPIRLQTLRPAVISKRAARPVFLMRQWAPVMVLLVILVGTMALQTTRLTGGIDFRAPGFAISSTPTVTSTSTPTATIASLTRPTVVSPVKHMDSVRSTISAAEPVAPITVTPIDVVLPVATPVAALAGNTTN